MMRLSWPQVSICPWWPKARTSLIYVRYMILLASIGIVYGDDITIRLEDGSIIIQNPQFIRVNGSTSVPELSFTLKNQTSSQWDTIDLEFTVTATCKGKSHQWTRLARVGRVGAYAKEYNDLIYALFGDVDGCVVNDIKATLVLAENRNIRIDGKLGERVDLEATRKAEAAAKARQEQIQAEEKAKKDATEAARQKKLAAERKKKQAAENARHAEAKAEQDAKEADERRKLQSACSVIYRNTADKKIKDLTVREEQQVRTCQALGLYPPQ